MAYKNGGDWLVIGRPITKGNIKKYSELFDLMFKKMIKRNKKFVFLI